MGWRVRVGEVLRRWRPLWMTAGALIAVMGLWLFGYGWVQRQCLQRGNTLACRASVPLEEWACDHGVGSGRLLGGCLYLSSRYRYGAGVKPDLRRSIDYRRRGCLAGSELCCALLDSDYYDGFWEPHYVLLWGGPTGPSPSPAYAPSWARPLEAVLPEAERLCATDFADGIRGTPDHHSLLRLFCDGLPTARAALEDAKESFPSFVASCQRGQAMACGIAGHLLMTGVGVTRDLPRGRRLRAQACAGGDEYACRPLGAEEPLMRGEALTQQAPPNQNQ